MPNARNGVCCESCSNCGSGQSLACCQGSCARFQDLDCAWDCVFVSTDTCDSCLPDISETTAATCCGRYLQAARYMLTGPSAAYVFACSTYFVYALLIMLIDIYSLGGYQYIPGIPVLTGSYAWSTDTANTLYLICAVIHFINAWQFAWAWQGRKWYDVVLWPEYMNVLGACLYLISASYYPDTTRILATPIPDPNSPDPANPIMITDYFNPLVLRVHYIETAAAVWELIAACGWCYTWWREYPRKPGRGWTLDDPDLHANINIFLPSLLYLSYNIQLLQDPTTYNANQLFIIGDASYFAGSILYLLGALRDAQWFWCMPLAGRCNPACPECPKQYGPHPGEVGAGEAELPYWGPTWGRVNDSTGMGKSLHSSQDLSSLSYINNQNPALAISIGKDTSTSSSNNSTSLKNAMSPGGIRMSNRALQRGGNSQRVNVLHVAAAPTAIPPTSTQTTSDELVSPTAINTPTPVAERQHLVNSNLHHRF